MKYHNHLLQSPNISNECTLGVEEKVQNVVDDAMSSHGVVVKKSISML